ncbi:hypothetical protein NDU88_011269 [Pleurodeles waltl]|uniref:Uncharacterized protein n=1 Tax=Pleurodeles waltl TaxID=8319 RepID=A0AAV7S1A2_PLEWA|nr:hypothetical protein NDU88_011269 [Pleurodeles waltl]
MHLGSGHEKKSEPTLDSSTYQLPPAWIMFTVAHIPKPKQKHTAPLHSGAEGQRPLGRGAGATKPAAAFAPPGCHLPPFDRKSREEAGLRDAGG